MSDYFRSNNNLFSYKANPEASIIENLKFYDPLNTRLWQPSETSLNFACPKVSFTKQQRFKLHSIYWPIRSQSPGHFSHLNKQRSDIDSIAKQISRRIDEQQKNEMRIKRRSQKSQKKILSTFNSSLKKKNEIIKKQMKQFMLNRKNLQITKRLTISSPKKQSLLRDRNGVRSNLVHGDDWDLYQVVKDEIQYMSGSDGFREDKKQGRTLTLSKRMNLNLPHNYYPGVGTYDVKRYLEGNEDSERQRAFTARDTSQRQK